MTQKTSPGYAGVFNVSRIRRAEEGDPAGASMSGRNRREELTMVGITVSTRTGYADISPERALVAEKERLFGPYG